MRPRSARAALLALALLSLPALPALPAATATGDTQATQYVTRVFKGSEAYELLELQPSYIPDKQCSGYIDNVKCPTQATVGVEVEVWDAARFPEVSVDDALATAAVRRGRGAAGECRGDAEVRVRVACVPPRPQHAPRPPRAARPPPAPRAPRLAPRRRLPPAPLLN